MTCFRASLNVSRVVHNLFS